MKTIFTILLLVAVLLPVIVPVAGAVKLAMSGWTFANDGSNLIRLENSLWRPHQNATPGMMTLANDSLFSEANFNQPLTEYAVGFVDPNNVAATADWYAPPVPTARHFTYNKFPNAEAFYSDGTDDDLRAIRGDFKAVEYTSEKVTTKTENRGLQIILDHDESDMSPGWEQREVARLLTRIHRNRLRRNVALLDAAATNTAKTWSTAAGKDPDGDVLAEFLLATTQSGVRPNRVGYGDTAYNTRTLSHRAQDLAGQGNSGGKTVAELSAFFGAEVNVSKERFTATSTLSEVLGSVVYLFNAQNGLSKEDPSNIKSFYSNTDAGGRFAVYVTQLSPKKTAVIVESYEKTAITSSLGIRKFTVSAA